MKALLRISRVIDAVNQRVGTFAFWLVLVMVLVGTFNTLARYLGRHFGLNLSSNAYIELQWYLFSAIFLLGGAYTLRHDAHVRVDVIYDRLSARHRAVINLVGHVIFLLPFCLLMLWFSWGPVAVSWRLWEKSPDPGGLPRYLVKSLIPLAFLLLSGQGISEIIKQLNILRHPEEESPPEEAAHL